MRFVDVHAMHAVTMGIPPALSRSQPSSHSWEAHQAIRQLTRLQRNLRLDRAPPQPTQAQQHPTQSAVPMEGHSSRKALLLSRMALQLLSCLNR